MFVQTWRQYWGITEDAFACEDADKDVIISEVDMGAVHSGFDRLFGDPRAPAPGIVFGEKGSGKSGLRLMMKRRLADHNEKHPDERIFEIDYIDFDLFLDEFRKRIGANKDGQKAAQAVVQNWSIQDHLDAILSQGVTNLVDGILSGKDRGKHISSKQKNELKVLTALYYRSRRLGTSEALKQVSSKLGFSSMRPTMLWMMRLLLTALAVFIALLPHLSEDLGSFMKSTYFYGAGGLLLVGTWLWAQKDKFSIRRLVKRSSKHIRVLAPNTVPLEQVLGDFGPGQRDELSLPGSEPASRYEILDRFLGLLETFKYTGAYILMDRVDEPSLISGHPERMRQFVEKLLDIKLLQYPNLAMKLFLPIELESLYQNANAEQMKRMRLDKSNLVSELKWSGQELQEVANQRLRARLAETARAKGLTDIFEEGFDFQHMRETLTNLGTPRYAFGFLSALTQEYVRDLPEDLPEYDDRWRVPRSHFDVVRAGWIDKTGRLRRSLN